MAGAYSLEKELVSVIVNAPCRREVGRMSHDTRACKHVECAAAEVAEWVTEWDRKRQRGRRGAERKRQKELAAQALYDAGVQRAKERAQKVRDMRRDVI